MSSFKLKVLLTGAATAGKTSLILKVVKNRFQADYKLTVGVDILTKNVEYREGEVATLSIWDIGAQQRFEFIRSTFYKGVAGALLVFDLTREQTYNETIEWLTEIRQITGPIPFVLIGNNVHSLKLTETAVIREEAREFARKEGGIYIETSPTSIDIIEEAFHELTRRIIELRN